MPARAEREREVGLKEKKRGREEGLSFFLFLLTCQTLFQTLQTSLKQT
jgi:hypothetical protein